MDLSVRDLGNWGTSFTRSLDLSVGDLSDRGNGGGWCLNLSVRDLSDWGAGASWGLDLSIRDLSNWSTSFGWGLNLSVRDLGDRCGSVGLDLSVRDLGHRVRHDRDDLGLTISVLGNWDWNSGTALGLSIGDLGNWVAAGRDGSWLTITLLSDRTTADGVDQHRVALRSPVLVIQVVDSSTVTFVEDVGATKSKGTVLTDGETTSVDGTGLRWCVELELVVGGDISCSSLGIGELTIGKSENKVVTLLDVTLGNGGSIVDSDLE